VPRVRTSLQLLGAVLAGVLAACSAPAPVDRAEPRPGPVVVASFAFAESELLGELYAQALESAGVPVRRQLGLGPRELVLPALQQGLVDVVPEYLGSALSALGEPPPDQPDADVMHRDLRDLLHREGLHVLRPASAQNQNGLAVTRATAERLDLASTSDLAAADQALSLTGPVECPGRRYCLPGLASVYGLAFERFVPYETERQRITALEQGLVDVAVVFTTDGRVAEGDLVLLADDRGLQPPEHVVPVVTDRAVLRHGSSLVATLDQVSAQLDSASLRFLNWRVQVAGGAVEDEAAGWLLRRGLVPR
jgi:osmoprotectant transport system substrate-binding protein